MGPNPSENGVAIAGGAIALALIERLVEKGVLAGSGTTKILQGAVNTIGLHQKTDAGLSALSILTDLLKSASR